MIYYISINRLIMREASMRFYRTPNKIWLFLGMNLLHITSYATKTTKHLKTSIAYAAHNIFSFETGIYNFISSASIIMGAALILFGFKQYGKHQLDSIETPLFSVVMLFIFSAACFGIAIISTHYKTIWNT